MVVTEKGVGAADGDSRWLWSDEVFNFSSLSSSVHRDLKELLVCSSVCSTSEMRHVSKSAGAELCVGIVASGKVPAAVFGDGKLGFFLCSTVGKEKASIAFLHLLVGAFLQLSGTYMLFVVVYGVHCNMLVHPLYGIH